MNATDLFLIDELASEDAGEQWWFDDDFDAATPSTTHGGSAPGRKPNKNRDYEGRYKRLNEQYFNSNATYSDSDFRRRFRMSKRLFQRLYDGVLEADPGYFSQRKNCAGKWGIHPLVRVVAALRMLAYATPADSLDENFEIGESTMMETFRHFLDAVIQSFSTEYLRQPTTADVERLLTVNARRGFVGMLYSIDCMHWEWQNCPVSLAGQFKGKEKKPTVVLEACADADLWIWYASVGWPGSLNDINILHRSDFFDRILRGEAPQVNFVVNGNRHDMAYCLADGIYPDWPVFLKTISEPRGNKRKLYAATQEACRKDVERAFGVLQARWHIINSPTKYWRRSDLKKIMQVCIILHNMIVENERDTDDRYAYLLEDRAAPIFRVSRPPGTRPRSINSTINHIRAIENSTKYLQLRDDIVEHIWQLHAEAD